MVLDVTKVATWEVRAMALVRTGAATEAEAAVEEARGAPEIGKELTQPGA